MVIVKEAEDYQGRSFLVPPAFTGVNLRADAAPDRLDFVIHCLQLILISIKLDNKFHSTIVLFLYIFFKVGYTKWGDGAKKWVVGQSMDNRIVLFQLIDDKLRFAKKKAFKGHNSAGYACTTDFSPDMRYFLLEVFLNYFISCFFHLIHIF
uniref:CPSF_A domain-containing protein n=1 Tax=Heterorhabditis bacteriophora TaxID=37862 RepID=A0A1I7XMY9_HETBA